jgi:hypothetical protein
VPVAVGAGSLGPAPTRRTFHPEAPSARANELRPMRLASRPSFLRRSLAVVFSDTVLFGLCTGILMMWLALRLLQG